METIIVKLPVLEVDILNNIIIDNTRSFDNPDGQKMLHKADILPGMKERFLKEYVGEEWNTPEDQLEYIVFYNNKEYFCQRRKQKFDFKSESIYWTSYEYKGATEEQVVNLQKKFADLMIITEKTKELSIVDKLKEIDTNYMFFDQRYAKRIMERNRFLAVSDWRVLPDVADTYEGEKNEWMAWRNALRTMTIKKLEDFPDTLAFLKHLYELKWPVDPKYYRKLYKNAEVEYLNLDDPLQWVDRDTKASVDFVESRLRNLYEMRQKYTDTTMKVRQDILDMMKKLNIHDFVDAGVDYSLFYTEEDLHDIST